MVKKDLISVHCFVCNHLIPLRLSKSGGPFTWCANCGTISHYRGAISLRQLGRRSVMNERGANEREIG